MQLHSIELQEKKKELASTAGLDSCASRRVSGTHEVSKQVHVVLLDPVAEDLGGSVALGEDQLDEPRRLLLGRRLGLETTVLLVSCGRRLELTDVWRRLGPTKNFLTS